MLTVFGTFAVTLMMGAYWLEPRSRWFVALFALGSALAAVYGLLAGTYPFFAVEALWTGIAVQRFLSRSRKEAQGHGI